MSYITGEDVVVDSVVITTNGIVNGDKVVVTKTKDAAATTMATTVTDAIKSTRV